MRKPSSIAVRSLLPFLTLAVGLAGSAACGDGTGTGDLDAGADAGLDAGLDAGPNQDGGPDAGLDGGGPVRAVFQTCSAAPSPASSTQSWEHPILTGATVLGSPDHSAQDVITVPGLSVDVVGKFAYGAVSKDLEDEWVEVWLDDCSAALVKLGEQRTNTDGRISLTLSASALPPVGAYAITLRVKGDDTSTRSWLRVVMPGTRAMVADIDGTLTTSDQELFQDIFAEYFAPLGAGTYLPVARADAIALTHRRRTEQGYLMVYVTGRPYYLTDITRSWLADLGAAPGHLHVTDSNAEAVPSNAGVGTFKADYLARLQALGIVFEAAYGNATTDIYGFETAGLDKSKTFILGSHGGESGTVDLGDDYTAHLLDIAAEPDAQQPFDW